MCQTSMTQEQVSLKLWMTFSGRPPEQRRMKARVVMGVKIIYRLVAIPAPQVIPAIVSTSYDVIMIIAYDIPIRNVVFKYYVGNMYVSRIQGCKPSIYEDTYRLCARVKES